MTRPQDGVRWTSMEAGDGSCFRPVMQSRRRAGRSSDRSPDPEGVQLEDSAGSQLDRTCPGALDNFISAGAPLRSHLKHPRPCGGKPPGENVWVFRRGLALGALAEPVHPLKVNLVGCGSLGILDSVALYRRYFGLELSHGSIRLSPQCQLQYAHRRSLTLTV